jgi:glyoxylase I family protein
MLFRCLIEVVVFCLHHVALYVSNLQRSIEFYEIFGFTPIYQYSSDDGNRNIAHLQLGEMLIELFYFPSAESQILSDKILMKNQNATGVKHFALRVASLQEALEKLRNLGLECTLPKRGLSGMDYFFVQDPDGILMEIVQDERERNNG